MTETVITSDSGVLGGALVFAGTRVPVRILFEHLEAGDRLEDFLESFPTVSRHQAIRTLELAEQGLSKAIDEAAA